jgi:phage terminase large subunit
MEALKPPTLSPQHGATSIQIPTLNPALRDFWLTPARNRILYGGRSSSKSWDAAGFAIFLAQMMPLRFLCTRQFQNNIDESVYTLLKRTIDRFGLRDRFKITSRKIICRTTGSEFVFYGLWRHIEEIKSMEAIDVHWSEEAHLFTEFQWKVVNPTLRKEGSQHWFIFNPRLRTDYVWKRWVVNPPPDTVVRKINYTENPFLSRTMLRVIEVAKGDDDFGHIYGGEPRDNDDESIIKAAHVRACIDAHKRKGIAIAGSKRAGFDIADDGPDKCAEVDAIGPLATWADLWKAKEDELLKSCTRVWSRARDTGADITYDAIGVGAHAGAKFAELNAAARRNVRYQKFFAGGQVCKPESIYANTGKKNKDFFANIKAQAWWHLGDRFRDTYNFVERGQHCDPSRLIFLDSGMPHLEQIIDELTTPKKDYDTAGRVKVESKEDLKKRGVASPNLGDAFVMAFLPEEMQRRSYFG